MSKAKKHRLIAILSILSIPIFIFIGIIIMSNGFSVSAESVVSTKRTVIAGKAAGDNATLTVNGKPVKIKDGAFSIRPTLKIGVNKFNFIYRSDNGNTDQDLIIKRLSAQEIKNRATVALVQDCKQRPQTRLKIIKSRWEKGGFGSVAIHKVLVKNPCAITLKDLQFRVSYFASSNTKLGGTSKTVYQAIGPQKTKWFKFSGLVHRQANSSSVEIVSAQ